MERGLEWWVPPPKFPTKFYPVPFMDSSVVYDSGCVDPKYCVDKSSV